MNPPSRPKALSSAHGFVPQVFQKIDPLILAGLKQTQKDEVVADG